MSEEFAGGNPENYPGEVEKLFSELVPESSPEKSKNNPRHLLEMSMIFPGSGPKNSWKCPGNSPEMSRKCSETVRKTPGFVSETSQEIRIP